MRHERRNLELREREEKKKPTIWVNKDNKINHRKPGSQQIASNLRFLTIFYSESYFGDGGEK